MILGYNSESCIALVRTQRRKIEVQYNGGTEHELISALGIYLSLFDFQGSQGRETVLKLFLIHNISSLQHFFFILPIIVTGSNAKLCIALTYCPHHVVSSEYNVCACVCACEYVYVYIRMADGSLPDSHEPRGLHLPFQICLFFKSLHTLTQAHSHTLLPQLVNVQRGLCRLRANRWEEQTGIKYS